MLFTLTSTSPSCLLFASSSCSHDHLNCMVLGPWGCAGHCLLLSSFCIPNSFTSAFWTVTEYLLSKMPLAMEAEVQAAFYVLFHRYLDPYFSFRLSFSRQRCLQFQLHSLRTCACNSAPELSWAFPKDGPANLQGAQPWVRHGVGELGFTVRKIPSFRSLHLDETDLS